MMEGASGTARAFYASRFTQAITLRFFCSSVNAAELDALRRGAREVDAGDDHAARRK